MSLSPSADNPITFESIVKLSLLVCKELHCGIYWRVCDHNEFYRMSVLGEVVLHLFRLSVANTKSVYIFFLILGSWSEHQKLRRASLEWIEVVLFTNAKQPRMTHVSKFRSTLQVMLTTSSYHLQAPSVYFITVH